MINFQKKSNQNFFFIALGAICGSLIRWGIGNNLIVNIVGSFVLGFILAQPMGLNLKYKNAISYGFCGALTTFSGWIFECLNL